MLNINMSEKKTQIKIYKIDKSLFPDVSIDTIAENIIQKANTGISDPTKQFKLQSFRDGFEIPEGFDFKIYHAIKEGKPSWVETWKETLEDSASMLTSKNWMSSFIGFVTYGNNIYSITGGLGNFTINHYIENFFGLDVIDRLLDSKQDRGIGEASKSGVTGNVKSESRTFYDLTDGFSQDSFETFFKQIKTKIDIDVSKEYFEQFYPKKDYRSFFQGGNYFLIRKSISIQSIFDLVKSIERVFIERKSSGHNKLIPIGSVNSFKVERTKRLNEALLHDLFNNQENPDALDSYYFAPKSIPEYQVDGSTFSIAERIGGTTEKFYDDMPRVSEYMNILLNIGGKKRVFTDEKDLKSAIEGFKIFWKHSEEKTFNPIDAFSSINGVLETNKKSYLLFEGSWYEMRDNFKDAINTEFAELVKNTNKVINLPSYLMPWIGVIEDDYNFNYLNKKEILVTHRVMKRDSVLSYMDTYVEYSDLIHLSADEPKLIHVKEKCNGSMRVAAAQVLMCAQKLNQEKRPDFFREYYGRIMNQSPTNSQRNKISEGDFARLGSSSNLKVCLAMSDNRILKDDPNLSLCGKFYFVKMFKDIEALGFGDKFFVINIQPE